MFGGTPPRAGHQTQNGPLAARPSTAHSSPELIVGSLHLDTLGSRMEIFGCEYAKAVDKAS